MTKDGTRTSHYDFELPADRIAQQPAPRRGDSRLMVVNRSTMRTSVNRVVSVFRRTN